jgi:hypothetical protein
MSAVSAEPPMLRRSTGTMRKSFTPITADTLRAFSSSTACRWP